MKAVIYEKFGTPEEVLFVGDKPEPVPGPGEVLVRMIASPINPSDLMAVHGGYSIIPELPATPGFEGVGIVEGSGGGMLGKLMIGKKVAVLNRDHGNWAEKTVTGSRQVIPLPKAMSDEQAAMCFINPATAYILTRDILKVPANEWLVQTAANSALGKMVIRLGLLFGFKTLNIVRREEDIEKLKFLGGHEVICFDAEKDDPDELVEKIKTITGGGMKYAIDPIGGKLASTVARAIGPKGRMILFGSLSNEQIEFQPRQMMTPGASFQGFWLGGYMMQQSLWSKMAIIRKTSKLIMDGTLSTDDYEVFPLDEVVQAVAASQTRGRTKKVILRIAEK